MNDDSVTIEVPAGSYTARSYRPDDEERVLELWRVAFGKELPASIWRWKYAANPFGSRILICLDENDEAAVVMYSGVPFAANWHGRRVEIVQLMDIMSHPDYRKTGLFVKTAEAYFDLFAGGDSVLYYGIPGEIHFNIGAKYLAYSRLGSDVGFFSVDPRRLNSQGAARIGRLREDRRPGAAHDALWRDLQQHYPLAVIRDQAFCRWRFADHPQRRYSLYSLRTGLLGRMRAHAVVGLEGETARIVDLLLPPDRTIAVSFLAQLTARLAQRGAAKIETWVPGSHFVAQMLSSAGYDSQPEPLGIVPTARSFDPELTIGWTSDNLYYTMADSDLV